MQRRLAAPVMLAVLASTLGLRWLWSSTTPPLMIDWDGRSSSPCRYALHQAQGQPFHRYHGLQKEQRQQRRQAVLQC